MSNLSVLPPNGLRPFHQQSSLDASQFQLEDASEVAPQEVYGPPQPPQPYGPALPEEHGVLPVPPEEEHLVPAAEYGPVLEEEARRFILENPEYGPLEPEQPGALEAFLRMAPTSFFAGLTSPVLTVVQTFSIGNEGNVAPSGVYYYLPSGAKLFSNSAFPISIGNSNHIGVTGSSTNGVGASITIIPGVGMYANVQAGNQGYESNGEGGDPQISGNFGFTFNPMKLIGQMLKPIATLAGQSHWTDILIHSPVQITIGPNWTATLKPNIVDGQHDGTWQVSVRDHVLIGRANLENLEAVNYLFSSAYEAYQIAEQGRSEELGMTVENIRSGGARRSCQPVPHC